jgi:hypothetical protein
VDVADRELERMVERRSRKDPEADEREELWKASVRRYNARRAGEMRAARVEYHRGQAARLRAVLEDLIEHHETQAERLCEGGVAS